MKLFAKIDLKNCRNFAWFCRNRRFKDWWVMGWDTPPPTPPPPPPPPHPPTHTHTTTMHTHTHTPPPRDLQGPQQRQCCQQLHNKTRTRWRRVKTLGRHQVGVNLQSHAQHQLWISTWHIFHEFHKMMPGWSYPVSLVNQNLILVNISHWRLHMAWIMSLMST